MTPELTSDDRAHLREMTETPGWKVMDKLLAWALEQNRNKAETVADDHRFWQGMCLAIRTVREFPAEYGKMPIAKNYGTGSYADIKLQALINAGR